MMVSLLFGMMKDDFFSEEQHHSLLVQNRMDHSKFQDLVKGLTVKVIVEKLTKYFEILDRFLIIKKGLPAVSYESVAAATFLPKSLKFWAPPHN